MTAAARHCRPVSRRGGVLLEVMLAMALFIGAAAFTLATTRAVFSDLERSLRQQQALDIARSLLAELEAGHISLADLRGEGLRGLGSFPDLDLGDQWTVEAQTQRTEHGNLTRLILTVRETADHDEAAAYTLRGLIRLREEDVDEYEADDLLDDLGDPWR